MTSMAAEYCFVSADACNANNHAHTGLSLKHYVHFTSPIRRFADVITHRLLKDPTYQVNPHHITNINAVNKQIKRATRDERKLAIMYEIEDRGVLVVDAYITEFQHRTIRVWINRYDITHAVETCLPEQEHYLQGKHHNNIFTLSNLQTGQSATLQQYQCVQVTIVPFPHQKVFNKKLNITINQLGCVYDQVHRCH